MAEKKEIAVGDVILVSVKNRIEESKPYLCKYEVEAVTRKYIIAHTVGQFDNRRFIKATGIHQPKDSKYIWQIWNSEEEYNEAVANGYYQNVTHIV